MSSFAPVNGGPPHKGKTHVKQKVKPIGQAAQSDHLRKRMKADDSAHVNMSDSKLGSGITSK